MKQFKRSDRVASQLLRYIQTILDEEVALRLDFLVTFTDVEMTGDLKYATVFYTVLGNDEAKERAARFLGRIRKRVQGQLGSMLRIKHIPELKFRFDPSTERGMRIEMLLNEISKQDAENKKSDT